MVWRHVPPGLDELADTAGVPLLGGLPMDWRYWLLAMNSGLPIHEQCRGAVTRTLQALVGNEMRRRCHQLELVAARAQ